MSLSWLLAEFKKDWRKPPNLATLTRLALSFVPALLLVTGDDFCRIVAFYSFVLLISTDCIDGWMARKFNQITPLGQVIDPIADRLIIGLTLVVLMLQNINNLPWLSVAFAWFIVAAFIIAAVLFNARRHGRAVSVNMSGKVKTVLLSVLIVCAIGSGIDEIRFISVLLPFLTVLALSASVISFFQYINNYVFVKKK